MSQPNDPKPEAQMRRASSADKALNEAAAAIEINEISARKKALKITAIYLIIGGLWILLSDKAVELLILDRKLMTLVSIGKGWFYVLTTALLIFSLTFAEMKKDVESRKKLRKLNEVLEKKVLERTIKFEETNSLLEEANATLEEINATLEEEVSERQHAEEIVRNLNSELESKVLFRTRELAAKNEILDEANSLFAAILESCPDILIVALDREYRYTAFNKRHKDMMLQLSNAEIRIGNCILDIIESPESRESLRSIFDKVLAGEWQMLSRTFGKENGSSLYWINYFSPVYSKDRQVIGITCFALNITGLRKAEERNYYLSYHDELTGLYNRRYYEEEKNNLDIPENLPISVIVGDVNGLKLINDAFGHEKGDELLQKAATLIKEACREEDVVTRWGGDEFLILMKNTTSAEAEDVVNRIREAYAGEYVNAIKISISLGWDTKTGMDRNLSGMIKRAEDFMYKRKIIENQGMRSDAINTIIKTLHEKNPREEQHSKRVSEICQNIGKVMGFSEIDIGKLKVVGLLHDIGKIAIEESILNKPGTLTPEEYQEIKQHPDIGFRILSTSHEMLEFAHCVLAHHERWDGGGYPKGLKGQEIPIVARIISVADTYDAMTSERPYRHALDEETALKEIRENSGTQFDPEVARIFVERVLNKAWEP